MIGSKLKTFLVLLACILGSTVAQAQTPAALIYDPDVGAVSFAAGAFIPNSEVERDF